MELSQIRNPSDIQSLSYAECDELAEQIRARIITTVSHNGGHLSSNLGAVEITLALHRAFHTPEDKIVFDVGHQSYAHKQLTGREPRFDTLRTYGGISGFPMTAESEHDCFETGHASTAISAALGLARARDALGQTHSVVALVGDGALTGGMCYEALNDCGSSKTRLIVVLNDNEMSIARNVGALSKHFAKLRASVGWSVTKRKVKSGLRKVPIIGAPLQRLIHNVKRALFNMVIDEGFFSSLGFHYLGTVDGHDVRKMQEIFERAKHLDEPVVIHCTTKKGYGYRKAEKRPEQFHGTPPFFIESGETLKKTHKLYGAVAADELIAMAKTDTRIHVVTAAMPLGTSVNRFQDVYPERCWDVGIAEEHAVTMCAGLARGGLRPFFFVYSTFLQRGYDQVLHDVCMQRLPVVFMIDRAGLSNEDGQTHQGLFDIAYLRSIPNITLLAPADANELKEMVRAAFKLGAPCAIRYPKTAIKANEGYPTTPFFIGHWKTLMKGTDGTILAVGTMVTAALNAAQVLKEENIDVEVVTASPIKPLGVKCLRRLASRGKPVLTLEEHAAMGGFGSAVLEADAAEQLGLSITVMGVAARFVPQGDHQRLLRDVRLDDASILQRAREVFR